MNALSAVLYRKVGRVCVAVRPRGGRCNAARKGVRRGSETETEGIRERRRPRWGKVREKKCAQNEGKRDGGREEAGHHTL